MCGDVQQPTPAMHDLEVPPEIPECPAHTTKTASLASLDLEEQLKLKSSVDCNFNEILQAEPVSLSYPPSSSFVVPDYLKFEINSEDNTTIKLKGSHVLEHVVATESSRTVDTVLSMMDGQIGAHRIVLAAVSPFLQSMFEDQQDSRIITVILPDISKKTMDTLLNIAYTGKLTYSESEEDDVFSAIETLRFCEFAKLTQRKVLKREILEEKPSSPIPSSSGSNAAGSEFMNETLSAMKKKKKKQKSIDSPVKKTESYIKILRQGHLQCKICSQKFRGYIMLFQHLEKVHNVRDSSMLGTSEELQKIKYCKKCTIQHQTISEIQNCLEGQNLSRCWVCLDDIQKGSLRRHYQDLHSDHVEKPFWVKCRWCPKVSNVSRCYAGLVSHCVSIHFPELEDEEHKKRGHRKRLFESDSTNSIPPRPKRGRQDVKVKPQYNPAEFGPEKCPPFFVGFNEATKNIVFNMNHFPKLAISLPAISKRDEKIYMSKLMREWKSVEQKRKEENHIPTINSSLNLNVHEVNNGQVMNEDPKPLDMDQSVLTKIYPEAPDQVHVGNVSLSPDIDTTANKTVVDGSEMWEP